MERLGKIVLKFILCMAFSIWLNTKTSIMSGLFERTNPDHGAFFNISTSVFACILLFGILYSAITIFLFCFTNTHFVLIANGLPIPFLIKIFAGCAGVLGYFYLLKVLSEYFEGSKFFEIFELFVLGPVFFWIDLITLIIFLVVAKKALSEPDNKENGDKN